MKKMTVNENKTIYLPAEDEADEILIAFGEAEKTASVAEWMERYPLQAREIALFASSRWVEDNLGNALPAASAASLNATRIQEIGMETLREFRAEREAAIAAAVKPAFTGIIAAAKSRGLDPQALAARLDIPFALVFKLHRRLISPDSVPRLLLQSLSESLERSFDEIAAYLRMPPTLAVGASYRADDAPAVAPQESFAEALQSDPDVTGEQRSRWLSADD